MPHPVRFAFLTLALALAGAGISAPTSAASSAATGQAERSPHTVRFDFESGPPPGRVAAGFTSSGTAAARLVARSVGGAAVTMSAGPRGGRGVRFPAWAASGSGRSAVLVSTPASRASVAPGARAFTFGASFRLDRRSSGNQRDNGDNLVQRGTYGGRGQFKIQLDRRVPSCRVKGDAGARVVKARRAVAPNQWYAVSCRRTATGLHLSVRSYAPGAKAAVTRVTGRTGNIVAGTQRFSIGGKVGPQGAPQPSSDQFNGAVDNVFLRWG